MKQKLVVIGNGMAGMKVVEEILSTSSDLFDITVFGDEPHGNYNRILLSLVLSGEKQIGDILINDLNWYRDNGITLYCGARKQVVNINRLERTVTSLDGTVSHYDRLLIATGSKPLVPDIAGAKLDGVVSFRDIHDAEKMLKSSREKKYAVVLGGGLLGLEAANGLAEQGMQVTVIHRSATILNRQLDEESAQLLQKELESRGIKFEINTQAISLNGNSAKHIQSVTLRCGKKLSCDLFVMAVGVMPNMALAKNARLYCGQGIVVNDTLQTYDPCIYAVGECIEHRNKTFGMVAPLFQQARVCANHLCGHGVGSYITLPIATRLKITGILVFSAGNFIGTDTSEVITLKDTKTKVYKKLIIDDNYLIGVVLYGEISDGTWFQHLIEKNIPIDKFRHVILFGQHFCSEYLDKEPVAGARITPKIAARSMTNIVDAASLTGSKLSVSA